MNNLHQSLVKDPGGTRRIWTHLVVSVVPDVNLVAHVPLQDLIPLLFRDKSGCVHGATITDDQAVALASLGQGKEGVLNLDHRAQKVFLHIQPQTEVTRDQYVEKAKLGIQMSVSKLTWNSI